MRRLTFLVLLLALFAGAGYGVRRQEPSSDTHLAGASGDASAATQVAPLKLPLGAPSIIINKSARRLVLYDGGRALRTYRVS
ncbi:MAG TPA: L,D-transpeptidase, partial [Pyrinomonadaceae bacterium]|nr:L,D-transpeptidase [Pyrinomonadaceae bacterium]